MPTGQTVTLISFGKMLGYFVSVALFEFLAIPQTLLWLLMVMLVVDFFTGLGKQYRVDKRAIKSDNAWFGIVKKVATLASLLSIAIAIKVAEMDPAVYTKGLLSILIMNEIYSTLQNVYAIRTGTILPEFDVISILIKKYMDFMKRLIESAVKAQIPERKKEDAGKVPESSGE